MGRIVTCFLFIVIGFANCHSTRVDNTKCEAQLKYLTDSLWKRETWAIDFFDSWTKFQSGVSYGNRIDFGNFDQCLEFHHIANNLSIDSIQGKHCIIYYRAVDNISTERQPDDDRFDWREIGLTIKQRNLRLGGGICVPSTCSSEKVQSFANEILSQADLLVTKDYDQSMFCSTNDAKDFRTIDIIAISVSAFFVMLLISNTLYEIVMLQTNRKPHELYSAFSMYMNGRKLFDISKKSSNIFYCLASIRTFAMLHIMLGHRYNFERGFPTVNANIIASDGKWNKSIYSALVNVHPIAVDSFFVMGGLLITLTTLRTIEIGQFNVLKLYVHRYLRITPVLAFLILIAVSVLWHLGTGPYHELYYQMALAKPCTERWWSALLHIQNYNEPLDACLPASWYLSADFQLVLISPLIIYPAYKWGWKFLWLLPTYIVGVQIWVFITVLTNNYKAARLLMPPDVGLASAKELYFPTHIRCGPWLIGVMLGYTLYKLKNRRITINKTLNATLWIFSFATLAAVILGLYPLQQFDDNSSKISHAFYLSLNRISWALAIGWIIFACHCGTGGIVKSFLELPLFQPMGRISLSFYLVHGMYQTITIGSSKIPRHFNDFHVMHNYAGDFIVSIFLASLLYLTFEQPILNIEHYFYKRKAENSKIST